MRKHLAIHPTYETEDRTLVVLLKSGPQAGHIAVIAEIIDHNRVGTFMSTLGLQTQVSSLAGDYRRAHDGCPSPIIPVQAHGAHTAHAQQAPSGGGVGCDKKAAGSGGHGSQVGKVVVGAEAGSDGEAAVVERF